MVMPEQAGLNLPEEMRFLLDAQMAEADLIVVNKTDTVSEEEVCSITDFIRSIYPEKPLMTMSAMKGQGVSEVVDYILAGRSEAVHREIGYGSDEFIAAEEKMSWFNTRVYLQNREEKNIDFNDVIADIFEGIRAGLKEKGGNVPHLKMFAADSDEEMTDFFKASMIGVDYDVIYDRKLDREYTTLSLIINARCAADPVIMTEIVDDAVDAVSVKYNLKVRTFFLESFGMMEEGKFNLAKASKY